ncbi:M15 family metallopeptidase [Neorhizobium galegae]|uniref:Peptidase M15C domain-containing protein n=1 Tax=Neorhizobium galegae bv. officinalis TaxID=323656 RepID=A0A0T7H0U7_NEOGA|nr:M15 family metallopeptidase [Neorhizobium galegae]CDZ53098.1 Hypothetical protein NGAL_HAMBI1189_48220 [Neorhizobium galegae bv. officinalis]
MSWSTDRPFLRGAAVLLAVLVCGPAEARELRLEEKIAALVKAYPDMIVASRDGRLIMKEGAPIPIDDGIRRNHAQMLAEGDVEDSLSQAYRPGSCEYHPPVDTDPGRVRSDELMKRLYGASANAVQSSLVPVAWFGETLRVTSRNGVDKALAAVRDELAADPALKTYLTPSAGVFNWRKVAGQANLSVHSFGAAIDLNTKHADYWLWSGGKPGNVPKYKNRFPMRIVAAFERHGFIWGGRWYHYDTMHFEYRPELLAIAGAAGISACD